MPSKHNRNSTERPSSEIRPTVEPGGPDVFDERGLGESKRRVAGHRAHGTINLTDQKLGESSGPDKYDGRENLGAGDSGGLDGKWNKIKSRPAVIISRNNVREVK